MSDTRYIVASDRSPIYEAFITKNPIPSCIGENTVIEAIAHATKRTLFNGDLRLFKIKIEENQCRVQSLMQGWNLNAFKDIHQAYDYANSKSLWI